MYKHVLTLLSYVSSTRRIQFISLLILMLITAIFEIASVGLLLPFITLLTGPEGLSNNSFFNDLISLLKIDINHATIYIFAAFCIVVLIAGVLRLSLLFYQTRLAHLIGADLSILIYTSVLNEPYYNRFTISASEIITIISDKVDKVVSDVLIPILSYISACTILTGLVFVMIAINPEVVILSFLIFCIIYFVITHFTRDLLLQRGKVVDKNQTKSYRAISEGLEGLREVILEGAQDFYTSYFKNSELELRKAKADISMISGSPRFAIEALGTVLIATVAYIFSTSEYKGVGVLEVLAIMAVCVQKMLPLLQQVYHANALLKGCTPTLKTVLGQLSNCKKFHTNFNLNYPILFENSIAFENVSFTYPGSITSAIQNLNIKINKGERIGVIGTSGSGKSTFLDLMMGLILPTKGRILIDGIELTPESVREWQRNISHVPQKIFIANTTVANNIAFGCEVSNINQEILYDACYKAQILNTIINLPAKFKTIIGDGGILLSGGQTQRLGIARALYKQSRLIVFDEATSALDSKTESLVVEALQMNMDVITTISVAHRASALKGCTRILEFENGKLTSDSKQPQVDWN